MATRRIITSEDDFLTRRSREITSFNQRLLELLDDMRETMSKAHGAGLAAPQVGVLRRVCIVENEDGEIIELVNPKIVYSEGEFTEKEGCLSVPGVVGIVTRPQKVRVSAFDRNGNPFETQGENIVSKALCHEIDHLDGILFTSKAISFVSDDEEEEPEDKTASTA